MKINICVQGDDNEWLFEVDGTLQDLNDWRDDGIECYVIENTIPEFIADIGLTKTWCFLQDIFNFKFKR